MKCTTPYISMQKPTTIRWKILNQTKNLALGFKQPVYMNYVTETACKWFQMEKRLASVWWRIHRKLWWRQWQKIQTWSWCWLSEGAARRTQCSAVPNLKN